MQDISPSSNPSTNPDYPFNWVKCRHKHDNNLVTVAILDNPSHVTKQITHPNPNLIASMEVIGILIIRKTSFVSFENCLARDSLPLNNSGQSRERPAPPIEPWIPHQQQGARGYIAAFLVSNQTTYVIIDFFI
jgi:hypothetical protein